MANWAFRASHFVAQWADWHVPSALRLAGPLGYWLGPAAGPRRCPSEAMVRQVWKELSPDDVLRVRRRITRQEFRNRTLRRVFKKQGAAGVARRLRMDAAPLLALHERGQPAIVASWHLGPVRANSLGLHGLGLPVLYATHAGPAGEPDLAGLRYFELKDDAFYARFLKAALDHLAQGGVVGMSLDAPYGRTEPVDFLGGTLPTPRGAAALARLSGAAVLPITSRWSPRGARMQVKIHPPLPEPDLSRSDRDAWERALLESALHWYADFLRANPETVRLKELRRYAREPHELSDPVGRTAHD